MNTDNSSKTTMLKIVKNIGTYISEIAMLPEITELLSVPKRRGTISDKHST